METGTESSGSWRPIPRARGHGHLCQELKVLETDVELKNQTYEIDNFVLLFLSIPCGPLNLRWTSFTLHVSVKFPNNSPHEKTVWQREIEGRKGRERVRER